jgi:hypothetical protein
MLSALTGILNSWRLWSLPSCHDGSIQHPRGPKEHVTFDYRVVVHHEYAPLGQTVTKEYY